MESVTELRKTHFLKPCVTSIDEGTVAELPLRRRRLTISSSDFEVLESKISSSGFRLANRDFTSWAKKMEALHEPTWRKAGIFEAIKASTCNIPKDPSLILALVEKWCPETKSFVFPWGEATITLEDVMVLFGFSVLGSSVNAPLESLEMREAMAKLERGRVENKSRDGRVCHKSWISSFRNIDDDDDDDDDKVEHEAFLTVWLSDFVFPDAWGLSISGNVLPLAVRLARGEKIALAPAVLASLYRDLTRIHGFVKSKSHKKRIKLESLFKLVQVWIWERFKNIRPEAREIQKGEPRIARWCLREHRCETNWRLCFDEFVWRPYAKSLKNWSHPKFNIKEAKWVSVDDSLDDEIVSFARCLRGSRLVGIGFVEDYCPNRVSMQFGFDQALPGLVTHLSPFTEEEAWDDYNKSLHGLKLYVPSRLATTSVSARYQDWWLKSVSEFLSDEEEVTETFNERNTGDKDHDDVSPKVLPLSKVVQKLGGGFHGILKRCKKRRNAKFVRSVVKKGKRGDRGGSTSREVLFQNVLAKRTSERLINKRCKRAREDADDDDDNITIVEMIKSRKKAGGDGSESLGERSRLEDNNGSALVHKPASENETVATQAIEQRSVENEEETVNEAEKTTDLVLSDEINSDEMLCSEAEKEDGVLDSELPDNDEPTNPQKLASECANGDDTSKAYDEANSHGQDEETVKSNELDVCRSDADMVNDSSEEPNILVQEDGTKEEESLMHGNGENQREKLCSEVKTKKEEIDERVKQRQLRMEEIALKLKARMMEVEKGLTKIEDWKTRGNKIKQEVSA